MKIVELTAHHVRVRLRRPIRHASHVRGETDNVVVRCVLDGGSVGHGEGVPRDYVTGETIDSVLDLLAKRPRRSTGPCPDFAAAVAQAGRLEPDPRPTTTAASAATPACCRAGLARRLWRRFGVPLSEASPPEVYPPSEVRYPGDHVREGPGSSACPLGCNGPTGRARSKVGIAGQDDVAWLRGRPAAAPGRRWTCASTRTRPGRRRERRPHPRRWSCPASPPPSSRCLDEQVACLADAQGGVHADHARRGVAVRSATPMRRRRGAVRPVQHPAVEVQVLPPSLRLVRLKAARGLGHQLGCQVGETVILSAAGWHLARASPASATSRAPTTVASSATPWARPTSPSSAWAGRPRCRAPGWALRSTWVALGAGTVRTVQLV
ncbi:MAG: hypothetical protein U0797_18555 [Gemmataceae bacterium]